MVPCRFGRVVRGEPCNRMTSSAETSLLSASRHVSAGVMWNTAFTFSKDALQFGLTMILARLLTPEVYGQFGFVSSITTFAAAVSFRSFLSHVLQLGNEENVDYDLHMTFAIVIQSSLFVLMNIVGIAFWFSPALRPTAIPLMAMSVLLFLDIPSEVYSRMLERSLEWSTLRALNMVGFITGALVSLILATRGAGVFALLIPNLIAPIPLIVHLFRKGWQAHWKWAPAEFKVPFRFGLFRIASGLLSQGRTLIESVTVAALLSFAGLGLYGRATGLAQLFVFRSVFLLMTSAYPVLTTLLAGTRHASRAAIMLLRVVCWGSATAGVFLALGSQPIITLVYGRQWIAAIPLVGAAVLSRAAAGYRYATTSLLLADNQARRCVALDAIALALFCVALSALWTSARLFLVLDGAVQIGVAIFGVFWLARKERGLFLALLRPLLEAAVVTTVVMALVRFGMPKVGGIAPVLFLAVAATLLVLFLFRLLFGREVDAITRVLPLRSVTRRFFLLRDSQLVPDA